MPQTVFLIFVIEMETTKTLFVLFWNSTQYAISKYGRTQYTGLKKRSRQYAKGKGWGSPSFITIEKQMK